MSRETFFHALAKAGAVPLLAVCWSDANEAVFRKMKDFFEEWVFARGSHFSVAGRWQNGRNGSETTRVHAHLGK